MPKSNPQKTPKNQTRYGGKRDLPSMATPRKPEPENKMGFMGLVFIVGILGGLAWLLMLIFGWGPYDTPALDITPRNTQVGVVFPTKLPLKTETLLPSMTATATFVPTSTRTPTPELMPFILIGEQESMSSALVRPDLDCGWLVIAGQVWDLQDAPVTGLTLHLFGELGGFSVDRYVLSGSAKAYGESGYEFALENVLVNSQGTLFIQLVDTNGLPLSHAYSIQTFNDCQKNLLMINFKQVR